MFGLSRRVNFRFIFSKAKKINLNLRFFVYGIIAFGIAHIIYLTAFGIKPLNYKFALALTILSLPVSAFYIPFLQNYLLKVIVPVYMIILLSMLWRAVSRLQIFNKEVKWTWTRLCCSIGKL